ncbi:MAG: hypothetical protein QOI16_182, partial [Pseudonocardiales bacterium]|nr:hypothetical protein [Pseudonocardiales bacterium]
RPVTSCIAAADDRILAETDLRNTWRYAPQWANKRPNCDTKVFVHVFP